MGCLRTKTEVIPDSRVFVASVCLSSDQTHHTSIPTVVVSLMTHDNMYVYMYVHVHVHENVHGFMFFF